MTRRLLLSALTAAVFAIAVLFHPPGRAYACSCVMPPPAGQARDEAAALFSGTVSAVGQAATPEGQVAVTFDVSEIWAGPVAPSLTLYTSPSSASCGYEFAPGKSYLVYAFPQDGRLATGLCTRTALLDDAADDLAILGEGQAAPQNTPEASPSQGALPWAPIAAGAAVVAAAAGAAVVAVRRRRAA